MTLIRAKRDTSPKFPFFLRLAIKAWPWPPRTVRATLGRGEATTPSPVPSGNEKDKP